MDAEPMWWRIRVPSIRAPKSSEYQLLLARDLGYLQPEVHRQLDDQVNEVKRMLNSFIKTLSQELTANR